MSTSEKVYNRIYGALGSTSKLLGSVGFLITFGFIVVDHLYGDPPGLLLSVVSLLLTRQLFGRLSNLVKDMQGLYSQKQQLSALFFHGQVFYPQVKNGQKGIWALIRPEIRDHWLHDLLNATFGQPITGFSVTWLDIGVPEVLCYQVTLRCDEGNKALIIKLFNSNRSAWAKHEATLLTSQSNLPTLPFIAATSVQGLHCHVLDATGASLCGKAETARELGDFKNRLAAYAPSDELKAVYLRSKPQAWQRFNKDLLLRMEYLLGTAKDDRALEEFRERLPSIQQILAKLPLAIDIPDLRPGALWKNEKGEYLAAHWARWDMEPLGARWPLGADSDEKLCKLLRDTAAEREDTSNILVQQVRLSALFAEFETRLTRGRYAAAYDLISPMVSEHDSINI